LNKEFLNSRAGLRGDFFCLTPIEKHNNLFYMIFHLGTSAAYMFENHFQEGKYSK